MTTALVPTTVEVVPVEATPADRHPAAIYIAGLGSPASRRTMRSALDTAADILAPGHDAWTMQWAALRYQHVAALRTVLSERYSPAQGNKVLSAVRGTLRASWRLQQIDAETYHRTIDVPRIRGSRLLAGRSLSQAELRSLFGVAAEDTTPAGRRDACLLGILYGGGLRRSEVADLALDDYDPEAGTLRVLNGKGGKQRIVHLPGGAARAVADWVAVRGPEPGPLLRGIRRGGTVTDGGMSASAVYLRLQTLATRASVPKFTPHDMRRSYVSDSLDAGADISAVAAQAGHSSVNITAKYDRRGQRAQAAAAGLLAVPYCGV